MAQSLVLDERQWDRCAEPRQMLYELAGRTSLRKLRLFAVACCRRVQHLIRWQYAREAVEVVAAVADGRLSEQEHREVLHWANQEYSASPVGLPADDATRSATAAALKALAVVRANQISGPLIEHVAIWTADNAAAAVGATGAERVAQAHLVREVFGNPYRKVGVRAEWLAWGEGTVSKGAEAIYEEEAFGQLPVLADALEEAGCTEAQLLQHFRAGGPHVRGCWALDLVLGKP